MITVVEESFRLAFICMGTPPFSLINIATSFMDRFIFTSATGSEQGVNAVIVPSK